MSQRLKSACRRQRRGLTLVELLMAMSIMSIMVGVLGGLAKAVQLSFDYSQGHAAAVQHARVTMERISRMVSEARATADYPGVVVVYDEVDGWRYPDTLVIWHPTGAPANANGPPLVKELVLICPDPSDPAHLVEITAPTDARPVPLNEELNGAWHAEIQAIKKAKTSQKVLLTDLVRVCSASSGSGPSTAKLRGAVRFERELRPSATQWTMYQGGSLAWNNLSWPQGVDSLRHVWLRMEVQLMPGEQAAESDPAGQQAIPFLGSAALYYRVTP